MLKQLPETHHTASSNCKMHSFHLISKGQLIESKYDEPENKNKKCQKS